MKTLLVAVAIIAVMIILWSSRDDFLPRRWPYPKVNVSANTMCPGTNLVNYTSKEFPTRLFCAAKCKQPI